MKRILLLLLVCALPIAAMSKEAANELLMNGVVQRALDNGADVNFVDTYRRTPLGLAIFFNNREIAALLIAKGANVRQACDSAGSSPLAYAAAWNRFEMVTLLLEKGAQLEDKNRSGDTALMAVVRHCNRAMVQFLIDQGADVGATNNAGETLDDVVNERIRQKMGLPREDREQDSLLRNAQEILKLIDQAKAAKGRKIKGIPI